jgi:hypothetical protein
MSTLTREEKIREARRLRACSWTAPQIGTFLSVPASTIRNWYLGGDCADCGVPIDGSDGDKAVRCSPCAAKAGAHWSRDLIVQRVREWNEIHGEPPVTYEWNPAMARWKKLPDAEGISRRYEAGDWPPTSVVEYHFGSWNAAIDAAGFPPLSVGSKRHLRAAA